MDTTVRRTDLLVVVMTIGLGACLFGSGKGGSGDSGMLPGWADEDAGSSEASEHDHHHSEQHDIGSATTLVLSFEDPSGASLDYRWSDPESDGSPVVDDVILTEGISYDLTVHVLNEAEDPVEDHTPEIEDSGTNYQFFFTGSAVFGPASSVSDAVLQHEYADTDANGLPLGIDNTMSVLRAGTGELTVTLRNFPLDDGQLTKQSGLAEQVAEDGFSSLPGDNEIKVSFAIRVD